MKMPFKEYGSGKPIVFLHAFPLSSEMWKPNISSIADSGFRVITPDFRGFGQNSNFADIHLMEDLAKDLANLLDDLMLEKAIICGLSMGGYVALNFFHLFPDRVSSLILCNSTYKNDTKEIRSARSDLINKIEIAGSKVLVDEQLPYLISDHTKIHNDDLVQRLKKTILKTESTAAIAALRGMAERLDHTNLLSKINIPTLIIFGENDKVINLDTATNLKNRISNSNLKIIRNAGHYSNLENPTEFNEAIIQFIETL